MTEVTPKNHRMIGIFRPFLVGAFGFVTTAGTKTALEISEAEFVLTSLVINPSRPSFVPPLVPTLLRTHSRGHAPGDFVYFRTSTSRKKPATRKSNNHIIPASSGEHVLPCCCDRAAPRRACAKLPEKAAGLPPLPDYVSSRERVLHQKTLRLSLP